jgi:Leu/Phe-tRNA-protein transferase
MHPEYHHFENQNHLKQESSSHPPSSSSSSSSSSMNTNNNVNRDKSLDANDTNTNHNTTTTTTSNADSSRMDDDDNIHDDNDADANTDANTDANADDPSDSSWKQNCHPATLLPSHLSDFVVHSHGDFFVSPCFDPRLVTQLMSEGFLPIATNCYLLPKLHKERCVIHPLNNKAIHTSKSTKKKLKRFSFSINQDFEGVVSGCHKQHGISWLYPQIVSAFQSIHKKSKSIQDDGCATPIIETNREDGSRVRIGTCPVKLFSVEVWNEKTGKLCGGELGYSVGSIYTSLTGFSNEDSAGSAQLAALGHILNLCGFEMWDLGMTLEYKTKLGAKDMNRMEFVGHVKEMRLKRPLVELACEERINCKEIFDMEFWGRGSNTGSGTGPGTGGDQPMSER